MSLERLTAGENPLRVPERLATGITLRGEGPSTVVRLADGVDDSAIIGQGMTDILLADFVLDCGAQSAGNGLHFWGCERVTLRNVGIRNCFGSPILFEQGCRDIRIEKCWSQGGGGHGINLDESEGLVVEGCTVRDSELSGINVSDCEDVTLTANKLLRREQSENGFAGLRFSNGARWITALGNIVRGHGRGIFVTTGASHVTLLGNQVRESWYQGILLEGIEGFDREAHITAIGNRVHNAGLIGHVEAVRVVGLQDWILRDNKVTADRKDASTLVLGTAPCSDFRSEEVMAW